jgi:hypothetical protein
MTPVLFLDFDGPMFPERQIKHSPPISEYPGKLKLHPFITYWEMDVTSVRQINFLHNIYNFDTVVSSSWKTFVTKEEVIELFKVNGLNLKLHEDWATSNNGRFTAQRVSEINWWLQDHLVDNKRLSHIILDDPWSGSSLLCGTWEELGLQEPFIIDPDVGIDTPCHQNMIKVVRTWRDNPSSRVY